MGFLMDKKQWIVSNTACLSVSAPFPEATILTHLSFHFRGCYLYNLFSTSGFTHFTHRLLLWCEDFATTSLPTSLDHSHILYINIYFYFIKLLQNGLQSHCVIRSSQYCCSSHHFPLLSFHPILLLTPQVQTYRYKQE